MQPSSGPQLILQLEDANGVRTCVGYAGLSVGNPAIIVLRSCGTLEAEQTLRDLHTALLLRLGQIFPKMALASVPCGGAAVLSCYALSERHCQKLLVIVGDHSQPIQWGPHHDLWLTGDSTFHVLPVLEQRSRTVASTLMPAQLKPINAEFWSVSVEEVLPAIFGLAGLTTTNPRIFISYRQKDSAALAVQLFDRLSHEGFDAFLDHFRISPGVNFQARLTQELGDKSMVLMIESVGTLESEWTLYEINLAKTCSLGIFALQVPNGVSVPGVDTSQRLTLNDLDFNGGLFSDTALLSENIVQTVVQRVKFEHDRALVRRRQILHDSLEGALLKQGIVLSAVSADGLVQVQSVNGIEYQVWLTPRPPQISDFHTVHGRVISPDKGVVIGLSRLMEPQQLNRTVWLSGLCQVKMVEEGQLTEAAAMMAQGTL